MLNRIKEGINSCESLFGIMNCKFWSWLCANHHSNPPIHRRIELAIVGESVTFDVTQSGEVTEAFSKPKNQERDCLPGASGMPRLIRKSEAFNVKFMSASR